MKRRSPSLLAIVLAKGREKGHQGRYREGGPGHKQGQVKGRERQSDRQEPCNTHKKENEADFTILLQVALQHR